MRANCRDTVRPFPAGRWDLNPNFQQVGGIQKIPYPSTISGSALLGLLSPFLPGGFQPLPSSRSRCYQDNARIEAHFGSSSVVLKTAKCSADICRQVEHSLVFVLSCVVLSRVLAVHTDIKVCCVVLCSIDSRSVAWLFCVEVCGTVVVFVVVV